MYIEHPYFYEGKYYANIDGEMIEIYEGKESNLPWSASTGKIPKN